MENEPQFKIGDVVILKSDALKHFPIVMTVNEIGMGKVTCVWSSGDKEFSERTFSAEALEIYEE
ncbi:MAG: hypothetical protein IJP75_06545 [Bacteroidaceae bacterium]|nr:hypothetical protein [Bacteroidaceae bacterium]